MASNAYYEWVSDGKPYVVTKPAAEFKALLKGYGYTVYDYPNEDHQKAEPPEDHTPYSATEWPVNVSAYIAHALDIMPPGATAVAKGAIALPTLARRIIADRDAQTPGTMWIKYMNWTDEAGVCRQESWKTTPRTTRSSTDKGHIHLSARTDTQNHSIGGWDPIMSIKTDPDGWAMANRVWAMSQMLGQFTYTMPDGTRRTETNKLGDFLRAMSAQQTEILAQARANGEVLSRIETKVNALALGGVDEQQIRDAVRAELDATRLARG